MAVNASSQPDRELETKLEQLYAVEPDVQFAARLERELASRQTRRARPARSAASRGFFGWAWRFSMGLAGVALLAGLIVFSMHLLPAHPAAQDALDYPSAPAAPQLTPTPQTYLVQEGDTAKQIAEDFGLSTTQLLAMNNLHAATEIRAGQVLNVAPQQSNGAQAMTTGSGPVDEEDVGFEVCGFDASWVRPSAEEQAQQWSDGRFAGADETTLRYYWDNNFLMNYDTASGSQDLRTLTGLWNLDSALYNGCLSAERQARVANLESAELWSIGYMVKQVKRAASNYTITVEPVGSGVWFVQFPRPAERGPLQISFVDAAGNLIAAIDEASMPGWPYSGLLPGQEPTAVPLSLAPDVCLAPQNAASQNRLAQASAMTLGGATVTAGDFTIDLWLYCGATGGATAGDASAIQGLRLRASASYQGVDQVEYLRVSDGFVPYTEEHEISGPDLQTGSIFTQDEGLHFSPGVTVDLSGAETALRYALVIRTPDGIGQGAVLDFTLLREADGYRPASVSARVLTADELAMGANQLPDNPPLPVLPSQVAPNLDSH